MDTETAKFIIPSKEASAYGNDTISVTVSRDYTWEKIGTADFTDGIFTGAAATVDVKKAKEGTNLYKFVAPMRTLYKQNGETTLPGGVDLIFTMDEEGNITMDQGTYEVESGTSLIAEGNALLYYDCKQYPDACFFDNNNGVITLSTLVAIGENLQGPFTWTFDWNKGYPYAAK